MQDAETSCQLYVVIEAGDAAPERLAAAFGAADLASVLIVPAAGRPLDAAAARTLIECPAPRCGGFGGGRCAARAQSRRRRRASGFTRRSRRCLPGGARHPGTKRCDRRRPGISRHDAMTMAEAGADYVASARRTPEGSREGAHAARRAGGLVGRVFQVPCVAFDVETAQEAEALAGAAWTSWGWRCRRANLRPPRAISWPRSPQPSARARRRAEGAAA